jgi:hypothetical protein
MSKAKLSLLVIIFLILFCSLQAKSFPKALLLSAVLPGSGEIYAGNLTRGVVFSSADILMLYGSFRLGSEIKWLETSYKKFAEVNAGILPDRESDYYELLQTYFSSADYNADMQLYFRNLGLYRYNDPDYYAEEISLYTISGDDVWQWVTREAWRQYKLKRRAKQSRVMDRKLVIGALIANRVVSVLDSAFLIKSYNKKHNPRFSVMPDFQSNTAYFTCSLEF